MLLAGEPRSGGGVVAYQGDGRLPVIYVRGFAGSGIDSAVDDPFYGFNEGSVHVRVDGASEPQFLQFESPLLRLMTDERYELRVQGNQRAYLQLQPDGDVPANTIWVHRFYDVSASTFGRNPEHFSLENAAADLFELVKLVRRKTGAPRVFLVAHSMGGLIARSMIQRVIPSDQEAGGRLAAATDFVERVFTYATPHGGIEFALGGGLLERFRDLTNIQGADIFGPDRMYDYLTPDLDGVPDRDHFDAHQMPANGFPVERLFCLVGTNPEDYATAFGLSSKPSAPAATAWCRSTTPTSKARTARSCTAATAAATASSTPKRATRTCAGSCSATSRSASTSSDSTCKAKKATTSSGNSRRLSRSAGYRCWCTSRPPPTTAPSRSNDAAAKTPATPPCRC